MPDRGNRSTNHDHELAQAERVGFECGAERTASEAVEHLAAALARVAAPIWHFGDGCGGVVMGMVATAALDAGLEAPSHRSPVTSRVLSLSRRDGWTCAYCRHPLGWGHECVRNPEVDHVIPRSQGGSNSLSNLVLACPPCNGAKGGRTPDQWRADLQDCSDAEF